MKEDVMQIKNPKYRWYVEFWESEFGQRLEGVQFYDDEKEADEAVARWTGPGFFCHKEKRLVDCDPSW